MEKTASLFGAPGRSDVWNANRHYCHFRRKYITLMMTIIASTELILIQTMCSSKLRMDSFHSGKHIVDRILLIRRVMLGAPSMWEIICKWSALWCCRVINKSSYQNEKWNFKNEEVSINLGHWCPWVFEPLPFQIECYSLQLPITHFHYPYWNKCRREIW